MNAFSHWRSCCTGVRVPRKRSLELVSRKKQHVEDDSIRQVALVLFECKQEMDPRTSEQE